MNTAACPTLPSAYDPKVAFERLLMNVRFQQKVRLYGLSFKIKIWKPKRHRGPARPITRRPRVWWTRRRSHALSRHAGNQDVSKEHVFRLWCCAGNYLWRQHIPRSGRHSCKLEKKKKAVFRFWIFNWRKLILCVYTGFPQSSHWLDSEIPWRKRSGCRRFIRNRCKQRALSGPGDARRSPCPVSASSRTGPPCAAHASPLWKRPREGGSPCRSQGRPVRHLRKLQFTAGEHRRSSHGQKQSTWPFFPLKISNRLWKYECVSTNTG